MKQRQIIDNFPIQGGLVNAGGQAMIPETSFWELEGAATGMDGRVYKRPGLEQWGQTIKSPDTGGVGIVETFTDISHFRITSNGDTVTETHEDVVVLKSSSTTETTHFMSLDRLVQPNDGTWDTAGRADIRFLFKADGALPAQSSNTALARGPGITVRTDGTDDYTFLFLDDGIYFWNGAAFVPSGADVNDSRWHIVEIRITGTASAQILIDEVLQDTITVTANQGQVVIDDARFALHAFVTDQGTYQVQFDFVQMRSGNENINGVPIESIFDWSSHAPDLKHLLVVAGGVLYDDRDHAGIFRAIDTTHKGDLTVFAPWLDSLLIANPREELKRWTGTGTPEAVPEVLPDNVYLVASHQSRVCVVSEDTPLLVHVSGANDITDWTTEDSVSPTGESFFIPIPDARGKRVVGMQGDFFGQLVIWTEESAFALIGSSIDTFVLRRISQATGVLGPRAVDLAAKDALFASSRGVHSIATVQEYGDLAASDLSANIRNLWQHDNQFDLRKMITNYRSSLVHAPELARTYLAVQQRGDDRPASIFEYNHDTRRWAGPWEIECEAIEYALLSVPGVPSLLVGDTGGRVSRVASDRRSDLVDTSYSFRVRSARLDGRSLDPSIRRRDKVWNELRLFVLPRGAKGIQLSYLADGHKRGQPEEVTVSQNVYNEGLVDTTFFLDSSHIVAAEKMAVVTQILDIRGKWFEFTVESSTTDSDLVILGYQVDFTVAQDSKENA